MISEDGRGHRRTPLLVAAGCLLLLLVGVGVFRVITTRQAAPASAPTTAAQPAQAEGGVTAPGQVVAYTGADVAWEQGPWGDTADPADGWRLMPRSSTNGPLVVHPDGRRTGFTQTEEGACLAEWTFATELVAAPAAIREQVQQEGTLDGAGYAGIGPSQLNRTNAWLPPNDAYLPSTAPAKRPYPVGCMAKTVSPVLTQVTMFWRMPGASQDSAMQTDWTWQDGTWVLSAPLDGDYLHPTVRVWTSPPLDSYLVAAPR